jgi:cytochrome b6-f complex iron-sulfur subunit
MNRREVVKLGVLGLCGACGGGGGDDPMVDAADPSAGIAMCGSDLCLDLTHPANAALANVDGARAVNAPNDKLIVVRTAATPAAFAVLSRVCTHNACGVAYDPALMQLRCPCHGSRFTLDGSVARGPATGSLKDFTSTFDEATQTLTIVLA